MYCCAFSTCMMCKVGAFICNDRGKGTFERDHGNAVSNEDRNKNQEFFIWKVNKTGHTVGLLLSLTENQHCFAAKTTKPTELPQHTTPGQRTDECAFSCSYNTKRYQIHVTFYLRRACTSCSILHFLSRTVC